MTWIRSPWWDSCWFLSGPALALLMLVPFWMPHEVRIWIMLALLGISIAHTVSPIALAWSHQGYRTMMLDRPRQFIAIPIVIMSTGAAVALVTILVAPDYRYQGGLLENIDLNNLWIPFIVWANLYAAWNLYHAGAQNFGFLCLYRRKGFRPFGRKMVVLAIAVAVTVGIAHFIPKLLPYQIAGLLCFGMATINHWAAAIGLSSHTWARHTGRSPWLFVGAVVLVGSVLAAAIHYAFLISMGAVLFALSLRAALGIVHFLYDRWVWKLSDPQVRATIGRELFA